LLKTFIKNFQELLQGKLSQGKFAQPDLKPQVINDKIGST